MTRLTAIEIRTNGDTIKCHASGPYNNGNFIGHVDLWRNGQLHKSLLHTRSIYTSKQEAIDTITQIVEEVRSISLMELKPQIRA